jgi:urease accessory protein
LNSAALTYERVCGAARIQYKVDSGGRTVLSDLYQRAPCRVLFPLVELDEPTQAVLLTTSGGLTGGDRTRFEMDVGAHARVTVTTQAAEKLYRALESDDETKVDIEMRVEEGAWAEWLAQETILFDGARLRRRLNVDLVSGARMLAVESLVLGRTAMGERFDTGFLHDSWRIRRDGQLLWADALHLDPGLVPARAGRFGFGTAIACSTLVYVGEDAAQHLAEARRLLNESSPPPAAAASVSGGATTFDGMLLIRILANDAARLRSLVMDLVAGLRRSAGGLPPRMPRVWYC